MTSSDVRTRGLDAILAAWTTRDLRAAAKAKRIRRLGRTKRTLATRLLDNGVFTGDVRWLL